MTHETFNVVLAVVGFPTVIGSVCVIAPWLVNRQGPAIAAYLRATEPAEPNMEEQLRTNLLIDSSAR